MASGPPRWTSLRLICPHCPSHAPKSLTVLPVLSPRPDAHPCRSASLLCTHSPCRPTWKNKFKTAAAAGFTTAPGDPAAAYVTPATAGPSDL